MGVFFIGGKSFASVARQGSEPITPEILAEVETSLLKQMEQLHAKLSPKTDPDESRRTPEATRPNSTSFWNAYLNYNDYTTSSSVWNKVGGSIGELYGPPDENSCATRVSWGLNYGGAPVVVFDAASVNLTDHTYNGVVGDGKRYIVSAMQMAAYMLAKWGTRDHRVTTSAQLTQVINGLGTKVAIFATPNPPGGHGHAGALKGGYTDPHVVNELPVDVWVLL